ncbi:hypothetical protein [Marinomonas gallaica]|uniref:hypothetical protein n=1 Tax=Marinomonas gallaica TaxID=1806667 RepID=UPI000829C038|nr:hypothetical protein [Marinomonas gallaica]
MSIEATRQYQLLDNGSYLVFASKPITELNEGEQVTFTIERTSNLSTSETVHWEVTEAGDALQQILQIQGTLSDTYINGDRSTALLSSFASDMAGDLVFSAGQKSASMTVATHDDPSISSNPYRSFPLVLTPEDSESFSVNYGIADQQSRTIELIPNQAAKFMTEGGQAVEIQIALETDTPYTLTLNELHEGGDVTANESPFTLESFETFAIYSPTGVLVTPTLAKDATTITFTPTESGQYRIIFVGDRATHDVSITEKDSDALITYVNFANDDSQVTTTDTSYELDIFTDTLDRELSLYSSLDPTHIEEGEETIITLERSSNLDVDETFVWAINLNSLYNSARDQIDWESFENQNPEYDQIDWENLENQWSELPEYFLPSYQQADWADVNSPLTGLLHFAAGESQASFTFSATDDHALEFNAERITLALSPISELPNIAGLTHTVSYIEEVSEGVFEQRTKVITETLTPDDVLANDGINTTLIIADNESPQQTMSVDDHLTFVQSEATPVGISIEFDTPGQYVFDLALVQDGNYQGENRAEITIFDSQGNQIDTLYTDHEVLVSFNLTAQDTGQYSFVFDSEKGAEKFSLDVYKDYTNDALQFFNNDEEALAQAAELVLDAVADNYIAGLHQQAQNLGIDTTLLSGIVNAAGLNGVSINDINQYFLDAGLSPL